MDRSTRSLDKSSRSMPPDSASNSGAGPAAMGARARRTSFANAAGSVNVARLPKQRLDTVLQQVHGSAAEYLSQVADGTLAADVATYKVLQLLTDFVNAANAAEGEQLMAAQAHLHTMVMKEMRRDAEHAMSEVERLNTVNTSLREQLLATRAQQRRDKEEFLRHNAFTARRVMHGQYNPGEVALGTELLDRMELDAQTSPCHSPLRSPLAQSLTPHQTPSGSGHMAQHSSVAAVTGSPTRPTPGDQETLKREQETVKRLKTELADAKARAQAEHGKTEAKLAALQRDSAETSRLCDSKLETLQSRVQSLQKIVQAQKEDYTALQRGHSKLSKENNALKLQVREVSSQLAVARGSQASATPPSAPPSSEPLTAVPPPSSRDASRMGSGARRPNSGGGMKSSFRYFKRQGIDVGDVGLGQIARNGSEVRFAGPSASGGTDAVDRPFSMFGPEGL